MIDVSAALQRMREAMPTWPRERSVKIAEELSATLAGHLNWDDGAGEDWAQVIGPVGVLALVGVRWPVTIVLERDLDLVRMLIPDDVACVTVSAMDEPELIASKESLFETFGERARSSALSTSGFSATDLWFATV